MRNAQPSSTVLLLTLLLLAAVGVLGGKLDEQEPVSTYYLSATSPTLRILEDQPQPDRVTRVTVRLNQAGVSQFMPVVTASITPGVVHSVVDTWQWLQVRTAVIDRQPVIQCPPAAAGWRCHNYMFPL